MRDASFDRHLPPFLSRPAWLFVPLWKYLALAVGFLLGALAVYALLPLLGRVSLRFFAKQTASEGRQLVKRVARPLSALVWLALAQAMVVMAGLPLLARERWYEIASKLGIAGFVWLILAIVNVTALAYRWRIDRSESVETMAVVRLIQRTVNFVCIFIGVVLVLRLAGYDVSAFVAGLGVGGLAIAFAAQKTLENLFGGIMLILDKPIRVGDQCRIGDSLATVQDIGLRSTRLRTSERTIMTVPNGQFSTMILDNLTMRDIIQFRHVLGIQMETGVDKL
jgi:MscS family membrane protein